MTQRPAPVDPLVELRYQLDNTRNPAWIRLGIWATLNANQHGHARAYPGQLRQALGDVSTREVSRAIRLPRERGVIDQCSTAGCLVLHAVAPCEANHREAA